MVVRVRGTLQRLRHIPQPALQPLLAPSTSSTRVRHPAGCPSPIRPARAWWRHDVAFHPRTRGTCLEGVAATSAFSDQVWLHGGLDILSVSLLLWLTSTRPTTPTGLRVAAVVALMPTAAILWTLFTTPFCPLFLVPGAGTVTFAVWGFWLSAAEPVTAAPAPAG